MTAADLRTFFEERFDELEAYLTLLQDIEVAAQSGPPRIENTAAIITAPQQKILYSSVYLQLYNLVEATVSRCIEEITAAASETGRWKPEDLNLQLRKEWVRTTARTHVTLTPDHRLEHAVAMCAQLIDRLPLEEFRVDLGGGGNWDDVAIERISARVGCQLKISRKTKAAAKRPVQDDLGGLQLVKNRRNRLAHGSISFVDCADGVSAHDLRDLANGVAAYLSETIDCFTSYLDLFEYLAANSAAAAAS